MKFGVPWSVKGIRPEARETAKEAARRSGVSLGEWLNSVIIDQAAQEGVQALSLVDEDSDGSDIATVNERLDDLTHRIEHMTRSGPAAYAPKRARNEPDQLTELIGRFDRRLDQFASVAPPPPPMMPPPTPSVRLPPSLDRAVAEIAARKRMLNGNATPTPRQQPQAPMAAAMPMAAPAPIPAAAPAPMPMPVQDLSGLEDQLRNITNQIETLRKPGVEQAINALREELGEIGRTLSDAMPRRAIDAIEKQIQGLDQRIAQGRQAGVDDGALGKIEYGLAQVRDALVHLTPAENLVGFNDAVAGLAHKIDLIVAQKDPATLTQLESAITTLREMTGHIASNETVHGLAAQVQALGEKVETMASAGAGGDALNHLEQRIGALSDALAERAQSGAAVPPRLEALVESLTDKIEQIQSSRGNGDAFGHLEDRIVKLVEKLDASDSRLGHLEAIERGLADLLVHIENKNAGGLRAQGAPEVDGLKQDIARTQDALEAVHGTLGHVVDRLAMIEKGIRGEPRPRSAPDSDAPLSQPASRVAVRAVADAPPLAAPMPPPPAAAVPPPAPPPQPAPRRMPPAAQLPIDPDLPPDQPLEPGSGPPALQANAAARIAASEAALGGARPAAAAGGKSSFIAAARRAAQAAGQEPNARALRAEPADAYAPETPSLRAKMMKRVKSLFVAASIIAIVVGLVQIAGNVLDLGNSDSRTAQAPAPTTDKTAEAIQTTAPEPTGRIAANPLALPKLPAIGSLASPSGGPAIATTPPAGFNPLTQAMPSLFNPPLLSAPGDVTGSISRPATQAARPAAPAAQPSYQSNDRLPIAIGGIKLRSAAVAGDAAAAYEVAVRYAEGNGVPVNLEEAARWYERAASKGVAPAQFRYASMLEKGLGVKKDLGAARRLYLAAASKGNSKAMHNLAVLYAEGIDGKPDYGTAVQWFRKAAQRGIADSQYNLGVLCARGLGTAKSYAEAYKWFALAAAQGDRESVKKRDDVAIHMDPAALAEAQQAVTSFVAEPQPEEAAAVHEPPGGWDHADGTPAPAKPRPAGPMSLGAFQVGKR
jgi:localization factor PodJL